MPQYAFAMLVNKQKPICFKLLAIKALLNIKLSKMQLAETELVTFVDVRVRVRSLIAFHIHGVRVKRLSESAVLFVMPANSATVTGVLKRKNSAEFNLLSRSNDSSVWRSIRRTA